MCSSSSSSSSRSSSSLGLRENRPPKLRAMTLLRRRSRQPGLPAGAGTASIEAAANPAKVDYLYMYAIKGDAKGRHYFTNNYEDFLRYQKEHPYS